MRISRESPVSSDLQHLMQRHWQAMHADTPPGSIHMMDAGQLDHPDIYFYVMRENSVPIGMGAIKRIDAAHAEIKSMHVLTEQRGRGLARQMVAHLIAQARAGNFTRLSLETGAQASFQPARSLYHSVGFQRCGAFEGYQDDPHSVFMTRALA